MLNLVIFGAPGSGKGTQGERIAQRYGLHHISTGEVLRNQIAAGTELGKLADSYISQGYLIPDDLMVQVLANELDSNPEKTAKGVIFDGFPRTIPQAEILGEMLRQRGTDLHAVIGLEVEDAELIDRLILRGAQTGRADDVPETIRERLQVYHKQTAPLQQYYQDRGKYHAIPGSGDIEAIAKRIAAGIDAIKA